MSPKTFSLDKFKQEVGWPEDGVAGLVSWDATTATVGYVFLSMLLYRILPAAEVEGTELKNGGKLKYRLNSTNSLQTTTLTD